MPPAKRRQSKQVQDLAGELKALVSQHKEAQAFIDEKVASADASGDGRDQILDLLSDDKSQALENIFARWKKINPKSVVQVLQYLGPSDHVAFFRSLTLRIPHPDPKVTRQPLSFMFDAIDGDLTGEIDLDQLQMSPISTAQSALANVGLKHFMQALGAGTKEVKTSYTQTRSILRCDHTEELVGMLDALCGCSDETFDTVFVNCIVCEVWQNLNNYYYLARILDCVILVLLAVICLRGRQELRTQSLILAPLVVLTTMCFMKSISQLLGFIRMFGVRKGLVKYFSHSGLAIFFTEVVSSSVLLPLCLPAICSNGWIDIFPRGQDQKCSIKEEDHDHDEHCLIAQHPNLLAAVVLSRWLQLVVSLMSTRLFGDTVLPAFNAVLCRDSLRFIVFLALFWFGCVNAYYIFPIEANSGSFEKNVAMAIKVFRLAFLGDFDLWELEGEDNGFVASRNGNRTGYVGSMEDPKANVRFHLGIRMYFVVVSMFFTILMMNVYIGVLGNAYNEQQAVSRVGTLKLRTQYIVRCLLTKWMLPFVNDDVTLGTSDSCELEGLWILWDPEAINKTRAADGPPLKDKLRRLEARLGRMEEILTTHAAKLNPR